jgi:hypothetical protein
MKLTAVNYQALDLKMIPGVLLNTLSVANIANNGVSMEHWQKYTDRGNRSARKKPCFSATLTTTNVICNDLGLSLGLTDDGLANNLLDQRTTPKTIIIELISLIRNIVELLLLLLLLLSSSSSSSSSSVAPFCRVFIHIFPRQTTSLGKSSRIR